MNDPKGIKILLIDDDPTSIGLVGKTLKSNGYDVLTATDAPVGLELAMKNKPDLIVLDVMMPIINGFNICRMMKTEDDQKDIPIILLTSRSSEEDRKIGTEVGADAYLSKPLNTDELLEKVCQLLNH